MARVKKPHAQRILTPETFGLDPNDPQVQAAFRILHEHYHDNAHLPRLAGASRSSLRKLPHIAMRVPNWISEGNRAYLERALGVDLTPAASVARVQGARIRAQSKEGIVKKVKVVAGIATKQYGHLGASLVAPGAPDVFQGEIQHAYATGKRPRISKLAKGVIGRRSYNKLYKSGPSGLVEDPLAGLQVATLLPIFRGPRALVAGAKAGLEGRGITEATRTAYRESRPIITSVKYAKSKLAPGTRTFVHNGLEVPIPAARSRTGRVVERVIDRAKTQGALRRQAGAELGRSAQFQIKQNTVPAQILRHHLRKLNDQQTQALRLMAEQVTPQERVAFHMAQAAQSPHADEQLYHQIHAGITQDAAKYLVPHPEGGVQFAPTAPPKLQAAYTALQNSSASREHALGLIGALSNERALSRIYAPGRVIKGARFIQHEQEVTNALNASQSRADVFAAIDQRVSPDVAAHQKALLDAQARHFAEATNDPTAVDRFYSFGTTLHETQYVPKEIWQKNDLLNQMAHQAQSPAIQKAYVNTARRLIRAHAGALPENAGTVTKLSHLLLQLRDRALQAEQFKTWYAESAKAILDHVGGNVQEAVKLAKLFAIYSPRAKVYDETAWNNTTRALGAYDEFNQTGQISDKWSLSKNTGHEDWQTKFANNAMNGGPDWVGMKTNPFYSNFLKTINPAQHDLEFPGGRVTIDTWMRRAFQYLKGTKAAREAATLPGIEAGIGKGTENISPAQYAFMSDATREIANELGWAPEEAQAAIWTSIKSELEGTPLGEAGVDFAGGIARTRERQAAEAHVQTLFDPNAIHTGLGELPGLPEPSAQAKLRAFLTRVAREHYPHRTLTSSLLTQVERHLNDSRVADNPLVAMYDSLKSAVEQAPQPEFMFQGHATPEAHAAVDYVQQHDGGTFFSNLTPDTADHGFFAAHGAYEQVIPADGLAADRLQAYRDAHASLFHDPNNRVGLWLNRDDNHIYLDVSRHFTDGHQALQFARKEGQLAIWDAAHGREIETGLTPEQANQIKDGLKAQQRGIVASATRQGVHAPLPQGQELNARGVYETQNPWIHLSQSSDLGTIAHEVAHHARGLLSPWEERQLANEMGAYYDKGTKSYIWNRAAEEKFANSVMAVLRTGTAPHSSVGLKRAFRAVAMDLRDHYEQYNLPDVSPHVAETILNTFKFAKLKGGHLVGAEDFVGQTGLTPIYVHYKRGAPLFRDRASRAVGSFVRRATSVFAGGRAAIGGGPRDTTLMHSFEGSLLLSGFYRVGLDSTVDQAMKASKLALAGVMRPKLVQAAEDIPTSFADVPIYVDPKATAPQDVARIHDLLDSLGGKEINGQELDQISHELAQKFQDSVFPSEINGQPVRDVVEQAIKDGTAVEGVKWLPADFVNETLLRSDLAQKGARTGLMRTIGRYGPMPVDVVNDLAKAGILFLNPAYAPVNLAGNLFMNLTQQGVFMPVNLFRSALMHRVLDPETAVYIDSYMGHGLTQALDFRSFMQKPGGILAHWLGKVVDVAPRRAAWLHEARREGVNVKDIPALVRDTSPEAMATKEAITRRANDAIVDYERLSPFEKNVLCRIIFVYPWLKGASRWTMRFAADHPMQAAALALAADYAYAAANQKLGERPSYAEMQFPVSTKTVGLKVPGTNLEAGLSSLVGEHGFNRTMNIRQIFTQTTPVELAQQAYGIATGGGDVSAFANLLAPVWNSAGVAAFGYDPFKHKEVPADFQTFLNQMVDIPLKQRIDALTMSEADRAKANRTKLNPRSKGDVWAQLFLGQLPPTKYNKEVGLGLVAKSKGSEAQAQYRIDKAARAAGVEVPQEVKDDIHWLAVFNKHVHKGATYAERLDVLLHVLAERYNDPSFRVDVTGIPEDAARQMYYQYRAEAFPTVNQFRKIVKQPAGATR